MSVRESARRKSSAPAGKSALAADDASNSHLCERASQVCEKIFQERNSFIVFHRVTGEKIFGVEEGVEYNFFPHCLLGKESAQNQQQSTSAFIVAGDYTSMKAILILASFIALAPMVRADEVVVKHEPTVVVHEKHHHDYHRHYAHHDTVVVQHPN